MVSAAEGFAEPVADHQRFGRAMGTGFSRRGRLQGVIPELAQGVIAAPRELAGDREERKLCVPSITNGSVVREIR